MTDIKNTDPNRGWVERNAPEFTLCWVPTCSTLTSSKSGLCNEHRDEIVGDPLGP